MQRSSALPPPLLGRLSSLCRNLRLPLSWTVTFNRLLATLTLTSVASLSGLISRLIRRLIRRLVGILVTTGHKRTRKEQAHATKGNRATECAGGTDKKSFQRVTAVNQSDSCSLVVLATGATFSPQRKCF